MEYTILFTNDAVVVSLFEAFTQSAVGNLFASCLFRILFYFVLRFTFHMDYYSLIFVTLSTLVCLHLLACHLLTICKCHFHAFIS